MKLEINLPFSLPEDPIVHFNYHQQFFRLSSMLAVQCAHVVIMSTILSSFIVVIVLPSTWATGAAWAGAAFAFVVVNDVVVVVVVKVLVHLLDRLWCCYEDGLWLLDCHWYKLYLGWWWSSYHDWLERCRWTWCSWCGIIVLIVFVILIILIILVILIILIVLIILIIVIIIIIVVVIIFV
jgi:hypothetical protein